MKNWVRAAGAGCAVALLTLSGTPGAVASPREVDEARLVPSLADSSFAPFDCKLRRTGPVCTGERHYETGWEDAGLPCDVPVYGMREEHRYQTRYYDTGYLNYDRRFRTHDLDSLSTSPDGPATATVRAQTRFDEPFAVPGDESTKSVITTGTIWDVRRATGPALFRAVGTLVEAPGVEPVFSGQVSEDGVSTRYDQVPLSAFFSEEEFLGLLCQAATTLS